MIYIGQHCCQLMIEKHRLIESFQSKCNHDKTKFRYKSFYTFWIFAFFYCFFIIEIQFKNMDIKTFSKTWFKQITSILFVKEIVQKWFSCYYINLCCHLLWRNFKKCFNHKLFTHKIFQTIKYLNCLNWKLNILMNFVHNNSIWNNFYFDLNKIWHFCLWFKFKKLRYSCKNCFNVLDET